MTIYTDREGNKHSKQADSKIRTRSGSFIICLYQNKILFVEETHAPNSPNLPGGGIDQGETAWQAVQREMLEETGLILPDVTPSKTHKKIAHYYADVDNEFWDYEQTYFLINEGIETLFFNGTKDAPENGIAEWINVNTLDHRNIHAIHLATIKEML